MNDDVRNERILKICGELESLSFFAIAGEMRLLALHLHPLAQDSLRQLESEVARLKVIVARSPPDTTEWEEYKASVW